VLQIIFIHFLLLSTLLHQEDVAVILAARWKWGPFEKNRMWKHETNDLFPRSSSIEWNDRQTCWPRCLKYTNQYSFIQCSSDICEIQAFGDHVRNDIKCYEVDNAAQMAANQKGVFNTVNRWKKYV